MHEGEAGRTGGRTAFVGLLGRHGGAVFITIAFVASRLAIYLAGVRFDTRSLNDALQLLDRGQLRDDLIGALANLHSQPPLFNLFVGLMLRVPHSWEITAFHVAYLAFGLGLALCLHAVFRRLGVGPKVGVALTLGFMLSPSALLYENWSHYDYPVTLLLCLAVLALQAYEDGHQPRQAAVFFALLAALVLTRSVFHLAWLLAWAIILALHRRRADWKGVMAAAAIPLIAVVTVYANTMRVGGTFGSSTLLGISLAKLTTFQLTDAERRDLADRGELSPVAVVEPLSPLKSYRGILPPRPPTGAAVLDDELKGVYTDPDTVEQWRQNFNNINYVDVANHHLRGAVRTMRIRPDAYLRGVATSYNIFFRPTGDFFTLYENRQRLSWLERVYNVGVYGMFSTDAGPNQLPDARTHYRAGPGRTAWLVILAYAAALIGGAWVIWRGRERGGRPAPLVLGFIWSTVIYVMLVSNAVDVGENNRFRLYTEPLVIALLAALVVAWRSRPTRRES